jgi:protein phosphatase
MRAVAWGLTDVGLQREHNEDSFVVLKDFDLFVVADGMGGHRAGDVASKLATEAISEFFRSTANEDVTWPFHFDTSLSEEENRLLTGIRVANRQIFDRSSRSREFHGMGTTVVGAMFSPKKSKMYIGHVGDSRCYRIRNGVIEQLTRDHSLFNDYLLAMPDLTEEQRRELPKNVITRALGMQDQVMVDLQHDDALVNDVYVLCSDGLSGMIKDEEILQIIASSGSEMRDAPKRLIERANQNGGEDNITAVVIRIEEFDGESDTPIPDEVEGAKTEMPPAGTAQVAVPTIRMRTPSFTDEPTAPAIDAREMQAAVSSASNPPSPATTERDKLEKDKAAELAKQFGEDPTLPAVDLSKELAALKKKDP